MKRAVLRADIRASVAERFGIDLEIREKSPSEVLPSGVEGIDIPRGTLTEISGPPSSGRNSILYGLLARTTRRPEFCALIDASGGFDPLSGTNAGTLLSG
jgi:RecA/RadA recombinase